MCFVGLALCDSALCWLLMELCSKTNSIKSHFSVAQKKKYFMRTKLKKQTSCLFCNTLFSVILSFLYHRLGSQYDYVCASSNAAFIGTNNFKEAANSVKYLFIHLNLILKA